jgi:hypothetical protein
MARRTRGFRHCYASLLIFEGATVGCVSRRLGRMSLCRERVLVLGVSLALLGAGCGSSGKLGAKALSQQSKSLQSLAAEGALLAQDAVSGKTTRIYTREHSSDLYKGASKVEASLKAAKTESELEPKLRQLAALATQISAALKRLGSTSKNEQRALGRELQTAARESKTISKEFK